VLKLVLSPVYALLGTIATGFAMFPILAGHLCGSLAFRMADYFAEFYFVV